MRSARDASFHQPSSVCSRSSAPPCRALAEPPPGVSLLAWFEDVSETVYIDCVHNNDLGHRLLAERIAEECGRLWSLKPVEH